MRQSRGRKRRVSSRGLRGGGYSKELKKVSWRERQMGGELRSNGMSPIKFFVKTVSIKKKTKGSDKKEEIELGNKTVTI